MKRSFKLLLLLAGGLLGLVGLLWLPTVRSGLAQDTPAALFLPLVQKRAALVEPVVLSSVGGSADSVHVADGRAYMGIGVDLVILDVSDPAQPQRLGSLRTPDGVAETQVVGGLAYVAARRAGLWIVDISRPDAPTVLARVASVDSSLGLTVVGQRVYLADGVRLRVLDVSNPRSPRVVKTLTANGAQRVRVQGNYAYVITDQYLLTLDLTSGQQVHQVYLNYTYDIDLAGGYLYVAANSADGQLQVFDLGNPAAPRQVSNTRLSVRATALDVDGGRAYVADRTLAVVDISDPAHPRQLLTYAVEGEALDVAATNGLLYVAADAGGLQVVQMGQPAPPVSQGVVPTPHEVMEMAVQGRWAYLAYVVQYSHDCQCNLTGLQVADLSGPLPRMRGALDFVHEVSGLAVGGDYVYLANSQAGLRVVDVSDPDAPREVGIYRLTEERDLALHVALVGHYALLTANTGIHVLDVSTPSAPRLVKVVRLHSRPGRITVANGLAFVTVYGDNWNTPAVVGGLSILDMSDPADPRPIGFSPGGVDGQNSSATDVVVRGNLAYVSEDFGLDILDVSDPTAPRRLGITFLWDSRRLLVADNYAYGVGDGKLRVYDIGNPAAPTEVYTFPPPDAYPTGVYAVALYNGQLLISRRVCPPDCDGRLELLSLASGPRLVGRYRVWKPQSVALSGDYALVTTEGGLRVLDIRDRAAPREVGGDDKPAFRVATQGQYAYVSHPNGLRVYDISVPALLRLVGEYTQRLPMPNAVTGVSVAGRYAYLPRALGGLVVVDIATPSAPREVAVYEGVIASNVYAVGPLVYLGLNGQLVGLDMSDPVHPRQVFARTGGVGVVGGAGNRVYSAQSPLLVVLDTANPARPRELGTGYLPQAYRSLAVVGPHVYLAGPFTPGVAVYDTSDLGEIRQVATLTTRAPVTDMAATGDTIITVDPTGGLVVHAVVGQ